MKLKQMVVLMIKTQDSRIKQSFDTILMTIDSKSLSY